MERVRTEPIDVVHGDGFTPLRGTGPLLAGSDDPRLGVMPGVAWTPGLPGGGGGSGGDQEFQGQNSGYTVEVLPLLYPGERVTALAVAEGRRWVSGLTTTGVGLQCQQPALWERETDGWVAHALPGLTEEFGGYAFAVTQRGLAVGHLQNNLCTSGEPRIPVVWTPLANDTWTVESLPSPHAGPTEGHAIDVAWVPTAGHVIVGWTVTAAGAARATVWRRSPDAWVAVDLGVVAEFSAAQSINGRGVVVGWTDDPVLPGQFVRPFMIVPVDVDRDGRLEWFHDADGDGRNDLMHLVTEGLPAGSHYPELNEALEAIGWRTEGLAPLVSVLQSGVAATGTPLDTREFEHAHARGISDSGQIVGEGQVATRDGTETRGLLWERQEDGVWLLQDLNDLVTLPHRDDRIGAAKRVNDCGDIIASAKVSRQNGAVVLVPAWSPCSVD